MSYDLPTMSQEEQEIIQDMIAMMDLATEDDIKNGLVDDNGLTVITADGDVKAMPTEFKFTADYESKQLKQTYWDNKRRKMITLVK